MARFDIEIVSDTVCPWCYVGKRKLDQAIAEYQRRHPDANDSFSTTWKPFYLNPAAPTTGTDQMAVYNDLFGEDRTRRMLARLVQIGAGVGIDFKFGGRTGSTRNSHRLVHLAKTKGTTMPTRVVEALMEAYFEHEQDITSLDVLTAAGVKAGLDESEVAEWLAGDTGGSDVDDEARAARRAGISGVPNITVNGRYDIGGAQDPDVYLEVFEKIKEAATETP